MTDTSRAIHLSFRENAKIPTNLRPNRREANLTCYAGGGVYLVLLGCFANMVEICEGTLPNYIYDYLVAGAPVR